ncbi:hypothetical protein [Pseudomonas sp. PB120]|uniref:hypothetical protein n=1 Tax=Pseudomonas sp. PB120 TaxID=2494700 RepID=UPI001C497F0D|nr:hypothetical protein [Pseudomonas sp. PB120]
MIDIVKMHALASGEPAFDTLDTSVDTGLFKKTWRINSTAAKAAICLLAQCQPKSFLTGANIDLGEALASYNSREFHHIYPKSYLNSLGIPFHESNVIANICLLNSVDNRQISDANPFDYFQRIDEKIKTSVFTASLIPPDFHDGSKLYVDFINARASNLASVASLLIAVGDYNRT